LDRDFISNRHIFVEFGRINTQKIMPAYFIVEYHLHNKFRNRRRRTGKAYKTGKFHQAGRSASRLTALIYGYTYTTFF
jgi:hypothetical protein